MSRLSRYTPAACCLAHYLIMPASQLILCHHCKKHTAVKICSKCADCRLLCAMCSASIHEKQNTSHHKPRQVCTDCFNAAANVSCHDCESSLCRACVLEHSRVCQPDTDSECARFLTSTDNLADTAPEEPLIEYIILEARCFCALLHVTSGRLFA